MSGLWVQIAQFFVALSLLIVLHEGGHFFFARLFKTRVEKFYLFFDFLFPFSNVLPFSLWKKKKGDTEYGIGWFPLGGYVKIAGMVDESMDKEQMAKPPEPWEFRSKKAWQRLLIMLGGIIVNVITAYLIYVMILMVWGQQRTPMNKLVNGIEVTDPLGYKMGFKDGDKIISVDGKPIQYYEDVRKEMIFGNTVVVDRGGVQTTIKLPVDALDQISKLQPKKSFIFELPVVPIIDSIVPDQPAEKAGLRKNDIIVNIGNTPTPTFAKVRDKLLSLKGKTVPVVVNRNQELDTVQIPITEDGTLGFVMVTPKTDEGYVRLLGFKPEIKKFGFFEAFPAAFNLSVEKITDYLRQFKVIFNPKTKAYKQVGGFDSMRKIFPEEWHWQSFWNITAFISLALAIMNLLPIPGLDGGYVMFTLWEMITGRKPNEKFLEVVTTIGLILLLILMVLANGNDILKYFK